MLTTQSTWTRGCAELNTNHCLTQHFFFIYLIKIQLLEEQDEGDFTHDHFWVIKDLEHVINKE